MTGSFSAFNNSPASGAVILTPTSEVVDSTGSLVLANTPIVAQLSTLGTISVPNLVATNNTGLYPSNWAYNFNIAVPGATGTFAAYLASTTGYVDISTLIPAPTPPSLTGPYVISLNGASGALTTAQLGAMPLPAGTPAEGDVPVATGVGQASAWGSAGGSVTSVFGRTGEVTAESGDYTYEQVGADASGAAAAAQTAAEGYAAAAIAALDLGTVSKISTNASTTEYLRGDGTWDVPPGSGGSGGAWFVAASGDETGATDVTNLQNALTSARTAGGGRVQGVPGSTYYLDSYLAIGSGCTLDMTDCIINVASGAGAVVRNYASVTPAASATDAAISSGSSVITTSLGASAVVGQSVVVAGATSAGVPFCGLVSAQTSTTITVTNLDGSALTAGATVSAASIQLYTRDKSVVVKGGFWNASTYGGNSPSNYKIQFGHLDTYTIDPQGVSVTTGVGYLIHVYDGTDGRVIGRNLYSTVSGSDGVHVTGPHYGLVVDEVTSTGLGDDGLSVTASNYPGDLTSGNVVGVRVGTIAVKTIATALKIIAGAGNYVDDVTVSGGIRGSTAGGIWIGDDHNEASTTGGSYGLIDLGHVGVQSSGATLINLYAPSARYISADIDYYPAGAEYVVETLAGGGSSVTVETLRLSGNMTYATGGTITFVNLTVSNVTIGHLIMDKTNLDTTTGVSALIQTHNGATITQADLVGCRVAFSTGNGYAVLLNSTTDSIGVLNFIGGNYTCYCLVGDGSTGATTVTLSGGVKISAGKYCLNTGVSSGTTSLKTFVFAGCQVVLSSGAYLVYVTRSTVLLKGDLITVSGGSGNLDRVEGTESVEAIGLALALDVSQLIRTGVGDMANNSNASLSCGVGPCISSGSGSSGSWQNLITGDTY